MTNTTVHVEAEDDPEPSSDETSAGADHAEETIIDAGIAAGIAAGTAQQASADAQNAVTDAQFAVLDAQDTAAVVHAENVDLRAVADDLRATATILAGIQASNVAQQTAGTLDDPGTGDDPEVDVEPENDHFLQKRWNFFGLGKKKAE